MLFRSHSINGTSNRLLQRHSPSMAAKCAFAFRSEQTLSNFEWGERLVGAIAVGSAAAWEELMASWRVHVVFSRRILHARTMERRAARRRPTRPPIVQEIARPPAWGRYILALKGSWQAPRDSR